MTEPIKISVEQLLQEIGALTMENKELRRRLTERERPEPADDDIIPIKGGPRVPQP